MNQNTLDDAGRPFEPATPEEFFQRGEEAFQIWWSELEPLRSSDGIEPDVEAARTVWLAAYEHSVPCILLVYDCAESSANAVPMSQAELAYVVHRHHNGSMTLPTQDFFDWVARHEDLIRQEYEEDERDADPGTLTIWIDHNGESLPAHPPNRIPPHSVEQLRIGANEEFSKWWRRSMATAPWKSTCLDRNKALIVWHEAYSRLWEDLEIVHDSATASADVVSDIALFELAYIIDRFHNGRLSFAASDALDYWNTDWYDLERCRDDDVITLRIRRVDEDCDG